MTFMSITRRRTRWLSASLVVVLLLTQMATVAFACAVEQAPRAVAPQVMADMPGCPEIMEAPAPRVSDTSLCFAHCDRGAQAVSPSLGLDLYGSTAVQSGFWVSNDPAPGLLAVIDRHHALDVPTTGWPPPYLTFLVLRN